MPIIGFRGLYMGMAFVVVAVFSCITSYTAETMAIKGCSLKLVNKQYILHSFQMGVFLLLKKSIFIVLAIFDKMELQEK